MELFKDFTMPSQVKNIRRKKKKYCKYVYTCGDKYMGGAKSRHVKCVELDMERRVPPHMGWLWTTEAYDIDKPRRGWRPGAIGRSVMKLMSKSHKIQEIDEAEKRAVEHTRFRRTKRSSIPNSEFSASEESHETKVALAVNKHGDVITVTVNPLREVSTESEIGDDPFLDCDPLVFRIVEKKSYAEEAAREAKKKRREKNRLENEIRRALEKAIAHICTCAYADVYCNDFQAIDSVIEKKPTFDETKCTCEEVEGSESSSDESDWEIEYTPPAAVAVPEKRRKANLVHAETQFVPKVELSEVTSKPRIRVLKLNSRSPSNKGAKR